MTFDPAARQPWQPEPPRGASAAADGPDAPPAEAPAPPPSAAPASPPPARQESSISDRMQALFSQAVEEQIDTQRQMSSLVDELRGEMRALGEQVRSDVDRMGSTIAEPQAATDALQRDLAALRERVDGLATEVRSLLDEAVTRIRADIEDGLVALAEALLTAQGARGSRAATPPPAATAPAAPMTPAPATAPAPTP
ncbi:MAG TPA: hypothetical protein VG708_14675, partial [Mycobacteriales bacterium]|nr:hypothetical protein [Mycobacteriales bacterium]